MFWHCIRSNLKQLTSDLPACLSRLNRGNKAAEITGSCSTGANTTVQGQLRETATHYIIMIHWPYRALLVKNCGFNEKSGKGYLPFCGPFQLFWWLKPLLRRTDRRKNNKQIPSGLTKNLLSGQLSISVIGKSGAGRQLQIAAWRKIRSTLSYFVPTSPTCDGIELYAKTNGTCQALIVRCVESHERSSPLKLLYRGPN